MEKFLTKFLLDFEDTAVLGSRLWWPGYLLFFCAQRIIKNCWIVVPKAYRRDLPIVWTVTIRPSNLFWRRSFEVTSDWLRPAQVKPLERRSLLACSSKARSFLVGNIVVLFPCKTNFCIGTLPEPPHYICFRRRAPMGHRYCRFCLSLNFLHQYTRLYYFVNSLWHFVL